MRFMVFRKADAETEAESSPAPSAALIEAMLKYNAELIDFGEFAADVREYEAQLRANT